MGGVSVGERVSDLRGAHEGKLVDIEGKTGYVLQANGVELEFPLDQLKPWEAPKTVEEKTLSGPLRDRTLSAEHARLLASVPRDLVAAVAKSHDLSSHGSTRTAFAALPDQKKLDAIRIHLPTLPQRLLAPHMRLVIAMRDLGKNGSGGKSGSGG